MKNNIKNISGALLLLLMTGLFATGCVEHRYYQEHHQHSSDYNHRHHRDSGVDIDIHNR